MSNAVVAFFTKMQTLSDGDYFDIETAAAEVKKLSHLDALMAHHAMKKVFETSPEQFAHIRDEIDDVKGLLKEQALRGSNMSPYNNNSLAMQHMDTHPELNILLVLGRLITDLLVFEEQSTTLDTLRAECAKHPAQSRRLIVHNISNDPNSRIYMPGSLYDEVIAIISPDQGI